MPPADAPGIVIAEMNSPGFEHGFLIDSFARQDVELADRNRSPATGRRDLHMRIECRERDGRIGRMHGVARTAVEDREILILAIDRRARRPAVLEAGNRAPKVPAARTLAEIAADRPHVPQRGRRDDIARLRRAREIVRGRADCVAMSAIARRRADADAAVVRSVDAGLRRRSFGDRRRRRARLISSAMVTSRSVPPPSGTAPGSPSCCAASSIDVGLPVEKGMRHRNKNGETGWSRPIKRDHTGPA